MIKSQSEYSPHTKKEYPSPKGEKDILQDLSLPQTCQHFPLSLGLVEKDGAEKNKHHYIGQWSFRRVVYSFALTGFLGLPIKSR